MSCLDEIASNMVSLKREVGWVDSHCHLGRRFYEEFGVEVPEVTAVVSDAENVRVKIIVTSGTSPDTNIESVRISNEFSSVYTTMGFHPHEAANYPVEDVIKNISDLLSKNRRKIIGIGEIGLDFYYNKDEFFKKKQIYAFRSMLEFSKECNLPVVIHCRDAWDDVKSLVSGQNLRGVFHCFSGEYEDAKWCVDKGFYLGIGGIVTFSNAEKLRSVVKKIGIENIVLETDSPWLAPQKFRGKVNSPSSIPVIGQFLAKILEIDVEEVKVETWNNFRECFGDKNRYGSASVSV